MLLLRCPECQKPLKVKEEFAGKKVKCPACGAPVRVTVAAPEESPPAVSAAAPPLAAPVPKAMPPQPAPVPKAMPPKPAPSPPVAAPVSKPAKSAPAVLEEEELPAEEVDDRPAPQMKPCKYCAELVAVDAQKCPYCDEVLRKKPKGAISVIGKLFMGCLILILLLFAFGVLGMLLFTHGVLDPLFRK